MPSWQNHIRELRCQDVLNSVPVPPAILNVQVTSLRLSQEHHRVCTCCREKMPSEDVVREILRRAQITNISPPTQRCDVCLRPFCSQLWTCLVRDTQTGHRESCGRCLDGLRRIRIGCEDISELWPGKNKFEANRLKVSLHFRFGEPGNLKGSLSPLRNDIYGAKCHAGNKFENKIVKYKFSDL